MGMSGDWEEAVKAGSTWLRLGSTILVTEHISQQLIIFYKNLVFKLAVNYK